MMQSLRTVSGRDVDLFCENDYNSSRKPDVSAKRACNLKARAVIFVEILLERSLTGE